MSILIALAILYGTMGIRPEIAYLLWHPGLHAAALLFAVMASFGGGILTLMDAIFDDD